MSAILCIAMTRPSTGALLCAARVGCHSARATFLLLTQHQHGLITDPLMSSTICSRAGSTCPDLQVAHPARAMLTRI